MSVMRRKEFGLEKKTKNILSLSLFFSFSTLLGEMSMNYNEDCSQD